MSAQEIWCLVALVAAAVSAVLFGLGPVVPGSWPHRAAQALLGASLAFLASALLIAL